MTSYLVPTDEWEELSHIKNEYEKLALITEALLNNIREDCPKLYYSKHLRCAMLDAVEALLEFHKNKKDDEE